MTTPQIKYPTELVHKYGAKAGILMYVKDCLPEIPQVDMIVKTPKESVKSALKRADNFPILWPRVFRSSAVEELEGFEGQFTTHAINGFEEGRRAITNPYYCGYYTDKTLFDKHIAEVVKNIQTSPRALKRHDPGRYEQLPDDICVIIAEKSPSSIVGTFIKHPNQRATYIVAALIEDTVNPSDSRLRGNKQSSAFIVENGKISPYEGFSKKDLEAEHTTLRREEVERLPQEVRQIVSWHDAIANLPQMDPSWSYQIEFGLDPVCLYQVRPFKQLEYADFELPKFERPCLVVGVTPKRGLVFRVERTAEDSPNRKLNPENYPSLLYDNMRNACGHQNLPNYQAGIFEEGWGLLAHSDINAMRHAKVTATYANWPDFNVNHGDFVRVISDGRSIDVNVLSQEEGKRRIGK